MIAPFALALNVLTQDPRAPLAALALEGRSREALALTQQELADRAAAMRPLGLDYLRGHLLEQLGRPGDAGEAFVAAMSSTPRLAPYSRYRLALEQMEAGHPEVAAGLVAGTLTGDLSSPLLPDAVRLFARAVALGGDCRLLHGIKPKQLPPPERRQIQLAEADCELHGGSPEIARTLLVSLLDENRQDDTARAAADHLQTLVTTTERGRVPLLLGLTFFDHREFERSLRQLGHILGTEGSGKPPSAHELTEAKYALARCHFWQGRYLQAAQVFHELAESARAASDRARNLLQEARCYEMAGQRERAAATFRLCFLAEPDGDQSPTALISQLRLEFRNGNESAALPLFETLSAHPAWRDSARRAALFLAVSDLVRGRGDRAGAWLDRAANGVRDDERPEISYWRGRLAELAGRPNDAVDSYLALFRIDASHPLAQSAFVRLGKEPLAAVAAALGHRLGSSRRADDLAGARFLLHTDDPVRRTAERRLRQLLDSDPVTQPFIRMAPTTVATWELWHSPIKRPEEMFLALGIFAEGAAAVREHFPPSDPSAALTGAELLARAGEVSRSILLAEAVRERLPDRLPLDLLPTIFQQLLYPFTYREPILAESRLRGVDPRLLAALIRAESRFDRQALSPAAARGLTQFSLPSARHVAGELGMAHLDPDDLYRPEVAIDLGGAYLAGLLKRSGGMAHLAIAAYNSGEPEAKLWQTYCFSKEPEEYYSKVSFRETRSYLARVLSNWVQYRRLYS
jgi:soluble lytic murein transglycosylase